MDWFNPHAKVAIVGITPGWRQMEVAYRTARAAMSSGASRAEALRRAKEAARFVGPMRRNLIAMLDALGLDKVLGLRTAAELFGERASLLHSTSLLRYPVFVRGKNYTGYNPRAMSHRFLRSMVERLFAPELVRLQDKLVIPLGRVVDEVVSSHIGGSAAVLSGFPHPSGANGHRHRAFKANRAGLVEVIERWASTAGPLYPGTRKPRPSR